MRGSEKLCEQLEKSSWAFRCLVTTQNTAAIKNLERFVVPASIVAKLYAVTKQRHAHGDFLRRSWRFSADAPLTVRSPPVRNLVRRVSKGAINLV